MDNEAVVRRAIDAIWNRGELCEADELFDPGYVNHNGLIPDLVRGPEAIKISVVFYRTAYPRLYIKVEESRSEGDTVVTTWAAYPEVPLGREERATKVQRLMAGITRIRLLHGKIIESWTQWDCGDLASRGDDPDVT